jgi:hypothetical protein
MKIPKSILFNAYIVPIYEHSQSQNDAQGFYDKRCNLISLNDDKDISEPAKAEVFMHELMEMINYRFSLDIPHKDITCLSEALFAVIRNNNIEFNQP